MRVGGYLVGLFHGLGGRIRANGGVYSMVIFRGRGIVVYLDFSAIMRGH